MAGISIELRRLYREGALSRVLLAFGYSVALSTGNWVFAIASIFLSAFIAVKLWGVLDTAIKYQIYVTYAVSISLILSGPFQLSFTRYISDRLFEKEFDRVFPNTNGVVILTAGYSFLIALFLSLFLFRGLPYYYHIIFSFTVSTLSVLWVTNTLLTGLKSYKYILLSFILCYGLAGLSFVFLSRLGAFLPIFGFYVSQLLLFFLIMFRVARDYKSDRVLEFDFLNKKRFYKSLALTGLFFNLALWVDKYLFWFNPLTGSVVFGNIRASVIYDVPVVMAILSLVPGFGIAFLKIELDFFRNYDEYYNAVRTWGKLEDLYRLGNRMIDSARSAFYDTLRFQAFTATLLVFVQDFIFRTLSLPLAYILLFNILLASNVLFMGYTAIYALLSYFDLRKELVFITLSLFVFNLSFTLITQFMGPYYYGYGYMFAVLLSLILGMEYLRRFLNDVHYRTFALRE
ncbi:exopolysaccharide Pel transporter PelG [Thermocrinis sp.]